MHKQTELTRENVSHTKLIRFWSEGKMAQTAYDRIERHRSTNHTDDAKAMLSEWLID